MAVVSISRIQVRRGRKNQGSGLPQLASGEFGWAIDSQELYIGNGSVAEGSPYVGNTKLLSEHDDLFQFANTYAYRSVDGFIQTGASPNNPVLRTLQDRLDDRVSVRSFGATGDGTDQTLEIQRAVDQLFLNAANKGTPQSRVELIFEPGEYRVSNTIFLPPYVTIRGAGIDKTFINGTTSTIFKTVNETSTIDNYAESSTTTTLNQPRSISITGMTISTTNAIALDLVQVKDSIFTDLKITGTWSIGNAPDRLKPAIKLSQAPTVAGCNDNIFENIEILNYSHGVVSNDDIKNNIWRKCKFDTLYVAIALGQDTIVGTPGQTTGPSNNIITDCVFDDISNVTIGVWNGQHNLSTTNKFYNVGNDGGSSGNALWPIIRFDSPSNQSDQDWFKRTEELGFSPTFLVNYPYTPELSGPTISRIGFTQQLSLTQTGEFSKFLKLPADTGKAYEIDYIYKSNQVDALRSGKINIVTDPQTSRASLSDDYDYAGDSNFDQNLEFIAEVYDENGDGTVDTVAILVLNSTSSDEATITFTINSKA